MIGLLDIENVILPKQCIIDIYNHLREMGQKQVEGVGLWAGIRDDKRFEIKATLIPKQMAYKMEEGLLYAVDAEELHRINVWLYQNKMTLVAQIHSHPHEAYHSDTDDRYPIVAVQGGLSIVIPDFAFGPPSIDLWAVYRLAPTGNWLQIPSIKLKNIIIITD